MNEKNKPDICRIAVDKYIQAWSESVPTVRAKLIEQCFAIDGRFVMKNREIRGRTALANEMLSFIEKKDLLGVRVTSEIDASGTTFRFHTVIDRKNGTELQAFDAGEINSADQISLILLAKQLLDLA